MVELTLLAARNILGGWGMEPVIATRTVAADAPTLLSLVADPASQWRLAAGISPLLSPVVRVSASGSPRVVHACLRLAGHDVVWFTWIVTPRRGTTEVDLAAQLESRRALVRLAMLLGGRRWLRGHLQATLGVLAGLALRAAEGLDDVERHGAIARGGRRVQRRDSLGRTPTQGAT